MKFSGLLAVVLLHLFGYALFFSGLIQFIGTQLSIRTLSVTILLWLLACSTGFASFYMTTVRERLRRYFYSQCISVGMVTLFAFFIMTKGADPTVIVVMLYWPFFFLNLAAFLPFLFRQKVTSGGLIGSAAIYMSAVALLCATCYPTAKTHSQLEELQVKTPRQEISRYRDSLYFATDKSKGVFKLTPDGAIRKIIDSNTQITEKYAPDAVCCIKENILYFKDGIAWKMLNLDTGKIDAAPDAQGCPYISPTDFIHPLGLQFLVYFARIADDGYVYFSSERGLHRMRCDANDIHLIIPEEVRVFDIVGDKVIFFQKDKLETRSLPPPRPPAPSASAAKDASPGTAGKETAQQLHNRGVRLYNAGLYTQAAEAWEKKCELMPGDASSANNVGIAHRQAKNYEKALIWHKKALRLNPSFGHGHYSLAIAYEETKQFRKAIDSYMKAIELGYKPGESYYYIGISYQGLSDHDKAIEAFNKALGLKYSPAGCYWSLFKSYGDLGMQEESKRAWKNYEAAKGPDPKP